MTTAPPLTAAHPNPATLSIRVILAIVFTVLAWASAFVVIRGVAPHFGGGSLALFRLIVGTVGLALITRGRGWRLPTAREWLLMVIYGVAWFGIYNVALNTAEHSLDAGTTAMIINIGPLLIALGAGVFLREGIPRWLVVGATVAFAGVVLIGLSQGIGALQSGGFRGGPGLPWALVAAVTYAVGVLVQKTVLSHETERGRLPTGQVTFLGCAIGMVACSPFAGALTSDLRVAPTASILGVIYLGLVPTALAFSTWGYALSRMPASQLGVTTYVVPALTVAAGALVFAEVPLPLAIVGGVLCLAGVALSRRRSRAAAVTPVANISS